MRFPNLLLVRDSTAAKLSEHAAVGSEELASESTVTTTLPQCVRHVCLFCA